MKLLLPISIILILGLFIYNQNVSDVNSKINADNGGNEAFLRQVQESSGEWVEDAETPVFDNKPVSQLPTKLEENGSIKVLGSHLASDGAEKWIEVDLSDMKLFAWEGNRKVYEFSVSTGRPGYKTPPGEYRVWRKVRSQRYRGGTPGTSGYYNLPNVPYSLFFYKGYAIHGAYWHNDFGIKNRSSGCINLHPDNAKLIYEWAGPAMSPGVNAVNSTSDNRGVRVLVHE
ncbi:hypothetical protein A2803_04760 [Candidatus Woesebacteria bacterium RIFCSPHIGHO2_01_FULL_44_21]|uniref:L,D-TPase catalytic domain-containing protein n=1 Tax=Candidatus Woesebacteria bacterium RIFCSPHIGHO2_01_FULL_44_21 TaxID=1802503 RepID=A0A1F7Z3G6_9BACT|nr:MAG: hypothetical protein A2803_04760 [Candidatus Woesebacteria bacterium RIFCSPHIGHO2_01_FULL_44_21]OGM69429.1 MAG: hypothetical protein A2897_03690 [Candidatus Woesebacteria bacterium RIFCSPLOWO2_01_FULL_44_24b]